MDELTFWQIIGGLIGIIAISGGAAYGLTRLFVWFRNDEQGYPNEEAIEEALLPFIFQAIMAAYKVSELAADRFAERLYGFDKAKIAQFVYALLPDFIPIGGKQIPIGWIRTLISEERFGELIEGVFVRFLEWFEARRVDFEDFLPDAEAAA